MFGALLNLLGGRDRLARLSRSNDRSAFVTALATADIHILAALTSDGLDAATFTEAELIAEVEDAAYLLSKSDAFTPFVYEEAGSIRLPFFSSMENAQKFCGEYSKERDRVYPFQVLGITGATLASIIDGADEIVLNPKSETALPLGGEDLALLQARWA